MIEVYLAQWCIYVVVIRDMIGFDLGMLPIWHTAYV